MHHGVPVVGAGKNEGKNDNNARIAHRRLGVDLRSDEPKPDQIATAVRKVLDDAKIKENVARLADELDSYDTLAIIERAIVSAVPTP